MATTAASPPSEPRAIDTAFRSALTRLSDRGRLQTYTAPADVHLEIAGIMKRLDGGPALLFSNVKGHAIPVVGNLLACQENCEAAFGVDFQTIREFVVRALADPQPPQIVRSAPVQECVVADDIDLGRMFPVLHHALADSGRFITAGIVVVRDPETGVYNASYHRLQLCGPARTGLLYTSDAADEL